MRREHKKRLNEFVRHHNDKLVEIRSLKQELDDKEVEKGKRVVEYYLNFVKQGNCQEVYDILVGNPEIINARDQGNNTALHEAVFNQNFDMVELLLFLGIDIFLKNNDKKDVEDIALDL